MCHRVISIIERVIVILFYKRGNLIMTYVASSNVVRRIDTTIKNLQLKNADQFNQTLHKLDDLNINAYQPHFQVQLNDFLTQNVHFKEAFRYEGWFTKNAIFGKWCRSENSDVERSKKILEGLIHAMKKRIDHLEIKKEAVLKKIDSILPSINKRLNYDHYSAPTTVSREPGRGGTDCPYQIKGRMEYQGQTKNSTYNKLELYSIELKKIMDEIKEIKALNLEAQKALDEMNELENLFTSYFKK